MRRLPQTLASLTLAVVACAPMPNQGAATGIVPIVLSAPLKPSLRTAFRTQAYDATDVYQANVSVNGPGMGAPVNATGNPISVPNGQSATAVQVVVPTGSNRVITAVGLDAGGGSLPAWVTVKGVTAVAGGVNPAVAVNWTTTPTGKVVDRLMALGSPFAASVDAAALQALVDQITVPAGASPATTYTVHPSRVDANAIAADIIANAGTVPAVPIPAYTQASATISGTVSGLMLNQTAQVVANDPGSAPVSTNAAGAYSIGGVTAGTGITVKATTPFDDITTTSVTVAAGGTGTGNMTLAPLHYVSRSLYGNGGAISNKVLRWSRMPINVLVVRPSNPAGIGWVADHETALNEALNRWTGHLGDIMSFNVTQTMDNSPTLAAEQAASDIYVDWIANFGDGRLGVANFSFSYCGGCTPNATDLRLHVTLATKLVNNDPQPNHTYRAVAIHEIGHALGSVGNPSTNGHSDIAFDNMYFSNDPYWPINLIPTARDFKSMRYLYSATANITRLP